MSGAEPSRRRGCLCHRVGYDVRVRVTVDAPETDEVRSWSGRSGQRKTREMQKSAASHLYQEVSLSRVNISLLSTGPVRLSNGLRFRPRIPIDPGIRSFPTLLIIRQTRNLIHKLTVYGRMRQHRDGED